jgi:hypothetical protein
MAATRVRSAAAVLGALTGVAILLIAVPAGANNAKPVSVPISTESVAVGGVTPSIVVIHIRVAGGPSVPVEVDTGSSGLTIVASDVGRQAKPTGIVESATYVGGRVVGPLMSGPITLGSLTTATSTKFLALPANQNSHDISILRRRYGVEGIFGSGLLMAIHQDPGTPRCCSFGRPTGRG